MKKQKHKANMFLLGILLLAGFFGFSQAALATEDFIIINEVLVETSADKRQEFIELYNTSNTDIDLSGFKLTKKSNGGTTETNLISAAKSHGIIPAHGYFVITSPEYKDFFQADLIYSGSSYSIAPDNTLFLYDKGGTMVTSLRYEGAKEDDSYAFDGQDWKWTSILTPGEENKFPVQKIYSDKIRFNELLPDPKGTDSASEFIEFYNAGDSPEDLDGWKIKDATEHSFKAKAKDALEIKPHDYLTINPADYGFSLINSRDNKLVLLSPDGNAKDIVGYVGSDVKENISYSFDGTLWHWTRFITRDGENKFSQPATAKIKRDKNAYAKMYVNFEAVVKNPDHSPLKITWDFGDGHKSYLFKTKHKYAKTGAYLASLKIFDGSEDTVENFPVIVTDFPNWDIDIKLISPNPKGKDAKKEHLVLKNNSTHQINLRDWSLATGWKKLTNHPIRKDFILKPGQSKKITRKYAAFTLNNKKSKIELRNPAGQSVAKIKYADKTGVREDVVYVKGKKKWQWHLSDKPSVKDAAKSASETLVTVLAAQKIETPAAIVSTKSEIPAEAEKINPPAVLGAETNQDPEIAFCPLSPPAAPSDSHKSRFSLKDFGWELNLFINRLFLVFK